MTGSSTDAIRGAGGVRRILAAALVMALPLAVADRAAGQDTQEAMAARVMARLRQLEAQPDFSAFGALTGLWRTDNPEIPVTTITHLGDVLVHQTVNERTGDTGTMGVAENRRGWTGWWAVACRGCCPGVGWWDRATLTVTPGRGALVRITTKKMDPQRCVLTETPDVIDLRLTPVRALGFREIVPGKLIHIVAAPAVGNQPAQYKAAVVPEWDLAGLGVATVTLAAPGRMLENRSTRLRGEVEFLTDRSGTYRFILVGWSAKGKALHFETRSIEIPPIPGIGR
jgi:hypothetical protein